MTAAKRIIYLVGFMGAGKTTSGTALARLLGWRFVDLDQEIESSTGRAVREIFSCEGEARFRRLEAEALQRVSKTDRAVVALGGGAFCSDANRKVIGDSGVSVWLDTPLATILDRCPSDGSRPLLARREEMEELLSRRLRHYRLAGIRILTEGLDPEQVARAILAALDMTG